MTNHQPGPTDRLSLNLTIRQVPNPWVYAGLALFYLVPFVASGMVVFAVLLSGSLPVGSRDNPPYRALWLWAWGLVSGTMYLAWARLIHVGPNPNFWLELGLLVVGSAIVAWHMTWVKRAEEAQVPTL